MSSSEEQTDDFQFPWKQRQILTFDITLHDSKWAGLGHKFEAFTLLLTRQIFNLFSKNFASPANLEIHSKKSRLSDNSKRDPVGFKVSKLQSTAM